MLYIENQLRRAFLVIRQTLEEFMCFLCVGIHLFVYHLYTTHSGYPYHISDGPVVSSSARDSMV